MAAIDTRKTPRRVAAQGRTVSKRPAARQQITAVTARKWSQRVTATSDTLDPKDGVFRETDPERIARSLKTSAEHTCRRSRDPHRPAVTTVSACGRSKAS